MTTATPHRRPASRRRWVWPVVALIGVSLGVSWAAWVAWDDVPPFQTQTHSFDIRDDQNTTVTFNVYRTDDVALSCLVLAQDLQKQVVGEKRIEVPAPTSEAERDKTVVTVELVTDRRPTTGYVHECHVD